MPRTIPNRPSAVPAAPLSVVMAATPCTATTRATPSPLLMTSLMARSTTPTTSLARFNAPPTLHGLCTLYTTIQLLPVSVTPIFRSAGCSGTRDNTMLPFPPLQRRCWLAHRLRWQLCKSRSRCHSYILYVPNRQNALVCGFDCESLIGYERVFRFPARGKNHRWHFWHVLDQEKAAPHRSHRRPQWDASKWLMSTSDFLCA